MISLVNVNTECRAMYEPKLNYTNLETDAMVDLCEAAGRLWSLNGNTKLPQNIEVLGKEIRIARSSTTPALGFIRAWKLAGAGKRRVAV
jgi:hypothetical protein